MLSTNEGDNTEPAINVANYSYSIPIILLSNISIKNILISVMQQSAAEKDRARTGKIFLHSSEDNQHELYRILS